MRHPHPLGLCLGIFFLAAHLTAKTDRHAYPSKLKIEKAIGGYNFFMNLKLSPGLYFYRKPEENLSLDKKKDVHYAKEFLNFQFDLFMKGKNSRVFQGINLGFTWLYKDDRAKQIYDDSGLWESSIWNFIYNGGYLFAFRRYGIFHSSTSGWLYRVFNWGFGPQVYFYDLRQMTRFNGLGEETRPIRSLKLGLNAFASLNYSMGRSPLSYGLEVAFTYIPSYPKANEKFSNYKVFNSFKHQQLIASFAFVLNFNVYTLKREKKYQDPDFR